MHNLMIIAIFPTVTSAPPPPVAPRAAWDRDLGMRMGFWGVPFCVTLIGIRGIFATGIQSQA